MPQAFHPAAWRSLAAMLMLLPGCTLIDQNTFNPNAGAVPVIPPAPVAAVVPPPPPGPPPLIALRMVQAGAYQAKLREAVALAHARKPTVEFDVTEIVPPSAEAAPGLGRDAATIARDIEGLGVPSSRVHLLARPEAGAAGREVRVYVR